MKDYKKLWEKLWYWLEEDGDTLLSPLITAAIKVQGKMLELEGEADDASKD